MNLIELIFFKKKRKKKRERKYANAPIEKVGLVLETVVNIDDRILCLIFKQTAPTKL